MIDTATLRAAVSGAHAAILLAWKNDPDHDLNDAELFHLRMAWEELGLFEEAKTPIGSPSPPANDPADGVSEDREPRET